MTITEQLAEARAILHSLFVTPTTEDFVQRLREHAAMHCPNPKCPVTRAKVLLNGMPNEVNGWKPLTPELSLLVREKELRDLESDSVVGSCNCLTKTPDIQHHKPGCKYRLIVERDGARAAVAAQSNTLRDVLDDIEARAEKNMLKTGKLEGMHYAALREVRAELGIPRAPLSLTIQSPPVSPSTPEQTEPAPAPSTSNPEPGHLEPSSDIAASPSNKSDTGGTRAIFDAIRAGKPKAAAKAKASSQASSTAPAKKPAAPPSEQPPTTPGSAQP